MGSFSLFWKRNGVLRTSGMTDPIRSRVNRLISWEASMKRLIPILMLLTAAVMTFEDRADAQSAGPTFFVENARIDIGEIKAGTEAVATFVFHNEGPTDVRIIRAKPS